MRLQKTLVLSLIGLIGLLVSLGTPVAAEQTVSAISQDAIRLRVLAHSDLEKDQSVKQAVWRRISAVLQPELVKTNRLSQARAVMYRLMPRLKLEIAHELKSQRVPYGFTIQFGEAWIPAKMLQGKKVPAGQYEALVVTLGSGAGQNWWCVLFPQLCELQDQNEHLPEPQTPRIWLVEAWHAVRAWFD